MNKITYREATLPKEGEFYRYKEASTLFAGHLFFLTYSNVAGLYWLYDLHDGTPWNDCGVVDPQCAFGISIDDFTRVTQPFTVTPDA